MKKIIEAFKRVGWKNFLLMNFGLLCCSVATVLFISPSNLIPGGSTGLSVFISMLTGLNYYIFLYGINIVLIFVSFFTLGKNFTIKTIYGSLMLPTYGALLSIILELVGYDSNALAKMISSVDPTFVVLFASILMGFGIGLNMKCGGSTGGFDILEAMGLKYLHIPYSTTVYGLDLILVVLGMIFYKPGEYALFQNGFAEALGAAVYIFILGYTIDAVSFGSFNKRAVFIRSDKYEDIREIIITKIHRGLTLIDAESGYKRETTKMIVCVCYSKEYFALRDMISIIDPNAFIIVTRATEVRGLGFNFETPEHLERHRRKRNSK